MLPHLQASRSVNLDCRTAMGLLSLGTPLAWNDAKKHADHVREHGITQFLNIWDRLKDRYGDELLWGDEVRLIYLHSWRNN